MISNIALLNLQLFQPGDRIGDKMMPNLTGENWKRIRTIVSPTFSTGKIKRVSFVLQKRIVY